VVLETADEVSSLFYYLMVFSSILSTSMPELAA